MGDREPLLGAGAPPLEGVDPAGGRVRVSGDGLVVFLTSTCVACHEVWPRLGDPPLPLVAAVTPDPTLEDPAQVAALAPAGTPVVMSTASWLAWRAGPAPWAVVVRGGTVVAEGPAGGLLRPGPPRPARP